MIAQIFLFYWCIMLMLTMTHFPGTRTRPDKVFHSQHLKQRLGNLKQCIIFIHAASGCDTTSVIYRKGKLASLKTLESNTELMRQIGAIYIKTSSCEEISSAGESYLDALYQAPRSIVTLNKLCYQSYNTLNECGI